MRNQIMSAAILFVAGCLPTPPHDCVTRSGLYVTNASCETVQVMQDRIEAEAKVLGFGTLAGTSLEIRTEGLNAGIALDTRLGPAGGVAYCTDPLMIVARGALVESWDQTSFAHEAFHVLQGCPWDQTVYDDCVWGYAENPANTLSEAVIKNVCTINADHPHWADKILPAIRRINSVEIKID